MDDPFLRGPDPSKGTRGGASERERERDALGTAQAEEVSTRRRLETA